MTQENTKLMLGVYDCIFKAIMLDPNNRDYLKEIDISFSDAHLYQLVENSYDLLDD